jgi:hypothetical protein
MSTKLVPYYEDEDMPYTHTRLVFPVGWIGTKLPDQWKDTMHIDSQGVKRGECKDDTRYFVIELLDTTDGKVYLDSNWPCYEQVYKDSVLTTIHIYLFLEHYCSCHRKCAAKDAGADTDEECEGERFKVKSITCPTHTGNLVLYSETQKADELMVPRELQVEMDEDICYRSRI